MKRVRPYFDYWGRRLGWGMVLGAALVVGASAIYATLGRSMDHRLHYLQTHMAQMRAEVDQRRQAWIPEAPEVAVQAFYRFLPLQKTIPDQLEKIFDAAYGNDLEVMQGTFKLEREPDAAFLRYQVELPVVGGYANIRGFANRVLKDIPSATLDDIRFSREDVKNPEVAARVRFTLYLGADK